MVCVYYLAPRGLTGGPLSDGGENMHATIERHTPDMLYILVPLSLAMLGVIAYFVGSRDLGMGLALLAYSTSALGSLLKT